jgi:hypothetical protein
MNDSSRYTTTKAGLLVPDTEVVRIYRETKNGARASAETGVSLCQAYAVLDRQGIDRDRAPRNKVTTAAKNCEICGKQFLRGLKSLKWWYTARYCSPQCSGIASRQDRNTTFDASYAVAESGCWEWQRTRSETNYGRFWDGARVVAAHRYSYARFVAEPGDLHVRHRCDNPPCVNPAHLELGSHRDNMLDAVERRRNTHGSRHPMSKITEDDVRFIRSSNLSGRQLAKQLGLAPSTISQIRSGQVWRHV